MKYKNIKSAAHNLGHSFLSDTNALMVDGRYTIIPELLFAEAARARVPEVRIDFLTGEVEPTALRLSSVQEAVSHYVRNLPDILRSQNIEPMAVRAAQLTVSFDYERVRRTQYHPIQETQEFSCVVEVLDDHGKLHRATPDHWWAV